jgi:hypothetical protein
MIVSAIGVGIIIAEKTGLKRQGREVDFHEVSLERRP